MKFCGFNTHAQGVKNPQALIEWHKVNQPSWALVMDGVQLARDIKLATPLTQVIVRQYMPDGFWYTQRPEDFLAFTDKEQIDHNLWVYVDNEAGINQDWNMRLIQANVKREHPRRLVLCNLSVGSWSVEQWEQSVELLKLADQYRDFVVLGVHEYFNVVSTSGFIGGYPDNAGAQPNLASLPNSTGRNLVPYAYWPTLLEAQSITKFHCGRFQFINQACAKHGIKIPRIVLTEHGQDDVSDIKAWVEKSVGSGIRGFKTLQDFWKKAYPDWSLGQTYFNMLRYLRNNVYYQSNVEGALLYCYGHIDKQWEGFDVEGSEVVDLLTSDPASPIRPLTETPIVVTSPPPLPAPQPPLIAPAPAPVVMTPLPPLSPVEPSKPIMVPTESRDWVFSFEVRNLTLTEAQLMMKLFPNMSAHIEQVKVA